MSVFPSTTRPTDTPWGPVEQAEQILPGIWSITTSSHGGLALSEQRQDAMPPALQLAEGFYEEDCDWSLVYIAFEDEFCKTRKDYGPDFIQLARDTAKCWHPDRMTKHTGKKVPPNVSPILRTRAAYQHALGDYCTTTAWGDWADWVPKGKVGVIAKRLVSVNHLGRPTFGEDEVCALIDNDTYETRGEVTTLSSVEHEIIDAPENLWPKRLA